MAYGEFISGMLVSIVIAVLPFLLITIALNRSDKYSWSAFHLGWIAWVFALILRIVPEKIPFLFLGDALNSNFSLLLITLGFAALVVAVFEESVRHFILTRNSAIVENRKLIFSFAFGWGLAETIVVYLPTMALAPFLSSAIPGFFELIPGAIERNLAIFGHLVFTIIVVRAVADKNKFYLYLAMLLHFILNIIASYGAVYYKSLWIAQFMIAIFLIFLMLVAQTLDKGYVKQSSRGLNT